MKVDFTNDLNLDLTRFKKNNLFRVEIKKDDKLIIDPDLIKRCSFPKLISHTIGDSTYGFEITFYNYHDPITYAFKEEFKRKDLYDIEIKYKILNRHKELLEEWIINKIIPIKIEYDDLNYDNNEVATFTCEFTTKLVQIKTEFPM